VRVLIADDDAMARRILASQLERLGHEVVAVPDGRSAVSTLDAANAPRMAILDWNMPELDGIAVCRWVRARAAQRYTYVALLTARNQPEDLIAALEAGADDFVTKPVTVPELRARLHAAQRILSFEQALLRSRAYLDAVIENIDSGVMLLDRDRRIVFANPALEQMFRLGKAEAIGLDRQQFLDRCAGLFDDFEAARRRLTPDEPSGQELADELPIDHPRPRVVRWSSKVVPLPDGDGRLDICRDVTREAELTQALKQQSQRDPLTGLLNRRGGQEATTREVSRTRREGKPLAVMLLDIDYFKLINDTCGHDVGDQVLQQVARAVEQTLRPYDIVIRWGGEEILVVAPGADAASALVAGERLRAAVEALSVPPLPGVTVSIGVDGLAPGETDLAAAVHRADGKLYAAKREGRNRVY
jgi:two-component system cell cycle response regulator